MNTTEWIIDIVLVLIVVRQIREEKLTARFVLLPVGIVAFVAHKWLHSVPATTANVVMLAGCVTTGAVLGVVGGLITKVRAENGTAYVQAGWAAASLWVVSMSARLGFIVWITHSGQDVIGRFSMQHHLTADVWQSALVLLALSEVVGRIGVIVVRGTLAAHRSAPAERVLVTA